MIAFVSLFILLLNRNSFAQMYHHRTCDVKTMCYIVFVSHSLHWRYIKTALQEYVIKVFLATIITELCCRLLTRVKLLHTSISSCAFGYIFHNAEKIARILTLPSSDTRNISRSW